MVSPTTPPTANKPPAAKQEKRRAASREASQQSQGKPVLPEPRKLAVERGFCQRGHKIGIYGAGGIGKSSLASLMREAGVEPLFLDVEMGTDFLDVARVNPESWMELRKTLQDQELVGQFGAVVVDSMTKAEELAGAYTLATVKHEKGHYVDRIEDYGYGKGYQHVFETFLHLFSDLDAIARRGINVVAICHDCTAEVPNPTGQDFLQYQPRLQSPPKIGKIRERFREWCDHLFFIGWDQYVANDGKVQGVGTRTIYPTQQPTHWAKSRVIADSFEYIEGDPALWTTLFSQE